jgi:hypothetical protein
MYLPWLRQLSIFYQYEEHTFQWKILFVIKLMWAVLYKKKIIQCQVTMKRKQLVEVKRTLLKGKKETAANIEVKV